MQWKVRIEMQRTGLPLPGSRCLIETVGPSPLSTLARAVVGLLPSIGAATVDLFAELRRARHPSRPPEPSPSEFEVG